MAISLQPPPNDTQDVKAWQDWFVKIHQFVRGTVTTSGDADYVLGSACTYHGVTALSAPRNLTLPAANKLQDGDTLTIQDEIGAAGTHTVTITRAGSDTINGANTTTISTNYGRKVLIKRGNGKWFSA